MSDPPDTKTERERERENRNNEKDTETRQKYRDAERSKSRKERPNTCPHTLSQRPRWPPRADLAPKSPQEPSRTPFEHPRASISALPGYDFCSQWAAGPPTSQHKIVHGTAQGRSRRLTTQPTKISNYNSYGKTFLCSIEVGFLFFPL